MSISHDNQETTMLTNYSKSIYGYATETEEIDFDSFANKSLDCPETGRTIDPENGLPLFLPTFLENSLRISFDNYLRDTRLSFNELTNEFLSGGQEINIDDLFDYVHRCIYSLKKNDPKFNFSELDRSDKLFEKTAFRIAKKNSFDPVLQYLKNLPKSSGNGLEKLYELLNLQGIEKIYMKNFLVAAVARRYDPGAEFNSLLVLHGPTETGKTAFFRTLFNVNNLRTNYIRKETGMNKEALENFLGKWCVCFDEMAYVRYEKKTEALKSMVTENSDRFRAPYDFRTADHLRSFVLSGTCNDFGWLKNSEAISRRFSIIEVPELYDIDALKAIKDEIWADARDAYLNGEEWLIKANSELSLEHRTRTASYREETTDESRLKDLLYVLSDSFIWLPSSEIVKACKTLRIFSNLRNPDRTIQETAIEFLREFGVKSPRKQRRLNSRRRWGYCLPDNLEKARNFDTATEFLISELQKSYSEFLRD